MKRRFLGIPVIGIIIMVVILSVAGGAVASFLWAKNVPSNVQILGHDIEVYVDKECTTPLTSLNFNSVFQDANSPIKAVWVKDKGDGTLYLGMSVLDLLPELSLMTGQSGAVSVDPTRTPILLNGYVDTVPPITDTLLNAIDATATVAGATNGWVTFPNGCIVKIDSELILFNKATGLTRGILGTTATAHNAGAVITVQQATSGTLQPGKVYPVQLYLSASDEALRGGEDFTIIFESKDTPY